MYRPPLANLISEMDAMISVKNDLEPGASCSSNLSEEEAKNAYLHLKIKHNNYTNFKTLESYRQVEALPGR